MCVIYIYIYLYIYNIYINKKAKLEEEIKLYTKLKQLCTVMEELYKVINYIYIKIFLLVCSVFII